MNLRTDEYREMAHLLETTKARARANRRLRNQARTDLRTQLLIQNPAATLECMNKRIRDLEMAAEADAESTLVASLISNLLALEASEKISQPFRKIQPLKPAS